MKIMTSKSKNSESFYISKGFINDNGVSTSFIIRKLGTLNDLLKEHGSTRDDIMIWTRVLEPTSKRSSFKVASEFLEKPSYHLHDVYRALDVMGKECDFIQSKVYKNSHFLRIRNEQVLYYDCTNYYFEIEQEDGDKKCGKSKEHRANPIIQMGLFMDGDGIPLAFSLFPGNANEQTSLKPLEKKVLGEFGCQKFIYCSDARMASEDIRAYNHMGKEPIS